MFLHRRLLQIISMIVILTIVFSGLPMRSASAQGKDGLKRQVNPQTGRVSFIGPESGHALPASQALGTFIHPQNPAMALAKRFGTEFGLKNPERDLKEMKSHHHQAEDGRITARYQQHYQGVPVLGAELIVNTNANGDLYSMNGEVASDLSLSIQPTTDSEQARQTALQAVAKWYQKTSEDFLVSEPELWIYDESLLRQSTRPSELVWRMEVTPKDVGMPVRELVLVNAQRGSISLHFNQIDTAWNFYSNNSSFNHLLNSDQTSADAVVHENPMFLTFSPLVNTYTANGTSSLPGSFLCNQSQPNCTNGSDPHADAAHKYAIGTFNLYDTQHNRNSIDNNGMIITSTAHYCDPILCPYPNAYWSGTQMVYGDQYGFPLADDVVAHELTHGVTQYESNLFSYYQSGAINESFSDLWGEYYDQTNGLGNDTAGVKWQIGEDVSGLGAIRNMSDPPALGDPDKMSSPNYYEGEDDNGGVHANAGVNNKAIYLMVDGGSFNGKTVTALGWTKTAAIYYEANTNLLASGADYSDLYYALQQACSNLIGQKGIASGDCTEVKDAVDAVEMNGQPAPNFNTDAPYCDAGNPVTTIFSDDLESGTGNWTFTNGAYPRWQLDSPSYGPYAQSGLHSLYADDYPDAITDASARLTAFSVPSNAYLHFAQAYGFETGYNPGDPTFYNFDGGVLEYSINNGSTWVDAGSLIDFNGYKGTIFTGAGNPLSGHSAFVGASHGYISTRLNLASLAGQTVSFRWRMGLDEAAYAWGWWVDNIKVYTCTIFPPAAFNKTLPANGGTGVGLSTTLSWGSSSSASYYQYCYDIINDNQCNRTWSAPLNATSADIANLGTNTAYYWQVRAVNAAGTTYANDQTWGSFTTTSTLPAGLGSIETFIGTTKHGKYSLGSGKSLRESYSGVNNGPVKIASTNAVPFIGAERVIYNVNNVPTSFSEMMALPNGQLDNTYWLPWYNNVDLDTQLRFGNVSGSTATVHVLIGGQEMTRCNSPYTLAAGASRRVSCAGVNNGPVQIISNVNIVAAERVIYNVNNIPTSFSEMMALPDSQLNSTYWLPWYNNVDLDTQLRFGNVSETNATATVHLYIGGQEMTNGCLPSNSPYTLAAGASLRVSCAGVNNGPVKIVSDIPIVAAERVIYKVNNLPTSFSEMMALPNSQLNTAYWLPWYNNVDLDTQLRFGNVSGSPAIVHVWIGGMEVTSGCTPSNSPYTLAVGASLRVSCTGMNNGPVQIISNVDIVAAERVIYKVNNIPTSFSEMMALPNSQLNTAYWLPWYNNIDLDTQLRFGVP